MITAVEEYRKTLIDLLKEAEVLVFSGMPIDGFKNAPVALGNSSWFPVERTGASSLLFFSFTETDKADRLFGLIEKLNEDLDTSNPIRVVQMPIERML